MPRFACHALAAGVCAGVVMSAFAAAGSLAAAGPPRAAKKTVCTITVNSADEKEAFRRALDPARYEFVELVEHGRRDWLESACRKGVRCDMLVISGHYDGGNEFFSDRIEAREYLPVDELERVSCSDSCPGLFARLREVYLFGCNTLDAGANRFPSAEIGRSLVRAGFSHDDAVRMARAIAQRHAESSKDRMRLIFRDVPAIYGFSSVAPLGPVAGSILQGYFGANGTAGVATGRVDAGLLRAFSAHALTVTSGIDEHDPLAAHRRDVCRFADDRVTPADRVAFVHALLDRQAAEARMFLPRLERFAATLDEPTWSIPAMAAALREISADAAARMRYLDLARDADSPAVRARMIALAQTLGWLSAGDVRDELARMWGEQLASGAITPADVDLACRLNAHGDYDGIVPFVPYGVPQPQAPAQAAVLACLGNADARDEVVRALTSPDGRDAAFAQAYLRRRPLDDGGEVRALVADIARVPAPIAQVRALRALTWQRLSDPANLHELVRLYPLTESVAVQTAIAGVLLRADYRSIASPDVVALLRAGRVATPTDSQNAIDVLIRRLETPD